MGPTRVRTRRTVLSLLTSVTVAIAAQVGFALQHPALAASCDTTWNGSTADWNTAADWSGGVPTLSTNACLPPGSYTVTLNGAQAMALTLVIATGPTVVIRNDNNNNASSLTVSSNATNAGTIQVGESGSNVGEFLSIGGTLTNTGTLLTVGSSGATTETILGNVNNQGSFTISQSTARFNTSGATLTNTGAISIASSGALRLDQTIFDLNGGTLTNAGSFTQNNGAFNHNGGIATGNALVLNGVTISPDPVSGSATFVMFGPNTLASNVSAGETLVITHDPGNNAGSLTVSSNATNAGTIQVGESGSNVGEFLSIGGTLTNTGTLLTVGSSGATTETILGNVINLGMFTISQSTARLDSGSFDDFGTLTVADGAALINASDTLTVEPGGSATLGPGGVYTQGSSGRLAVTVDAAHGTNTFVSGGNYNLAGTLKVTTLGVPALNSKWQVIFGNIATSPFGIYDFGSVNYSVNYAPTPPGVTLTMLTGFSMIQTAPSSTTGTVTPVPGSGVSTGSTVYDAVTITGNSSTQRASGSVTFYICSPATLAAHRATTCSSSIGIAFDTEPLPPGPGSTATAFSTGQIVGAEGTWCFAAYYSGDSTFPASSDTTTGECFLVRSGESPITPSGMGVNATEGQSFAGTLATFTDPDPNSTAPEYSATINWGDGASSAGTISGPTGGPFTIGGTHTYSDEGTFTATVAITDVDNAANDARASSTVIVADGVLTAGELTVTGGTEGSAAATVTFNFSDANPASTAGDFSATISWGDGSSSSGTVIAVSGSSYRVSASHTFSEEGTYPLTVTVNDDGGKAVTARGAGTVADARLTAACAAPPAATQDFNGVTATFTDAASPGGTLSDFSATIFWGDGSSSTGTVNGSNGGPYVVSGSHHYANTNRFTITTSINDVGGSVASTSCSTLVFAFAPGGGAFVIGDGNGAVGMNVTFWGAQWSQRNSLSGGSAPASFKGFAESPAMPACQLNWSTDPGNSAPPPAGPLPTYMAVIVSSSTTASGAEISGNTVHIVIVKVKPGYAPDPGSPGMGTVVAQLC